MNALINAQVFYRKHGVRTDAQLMAPVRKPLAELVLPLNSIYHHIEYDGISTGPDASHPLLAGQIKSISVLSPVELMGNEGAPRKQNLSVDQMEKKLVARNRKLRITRNMQSVLADHNSLVCINYNFLFHAWKYIRAQYSEIFKWRNAFQTVVHNLCEQLELSERNHYLLAGSAPVMPSIAQLNASDEQIPANLISIFNKPNALLLLEIWKWLSKDQRPSSFLSKIKLNKIHLVNFVFVEAGQFVVINLGVLNSFRADKQAIKDLAPGNENLPFFKPNNPQEAFSIQKRLLMFYMRLCEVNNASVNVEEVVEEKEGEEKKEPGLPSTSLNEVSESNVELQSVEQLAREEGQPLSEKEAKAIRDEEEKQIDEVLAQLENISMRRTLDDDGDSLISVKEIKQAKPIGLDEAIEVACDRLESSGSLSAAQYKLFKNTSQKYKQLKHPFGEGTVEQALRIAPQELVIDRKTLPKSVTVHDESMLKDSLGDYDKSYVTKILPRHLTQMTMSVQRAGYCVTDFTAEKKGDIMGEFHDVRLSLLPVEGSASTIHMKLPDISPNGVMRANDINYRLKKLRVDIPIRKVAPERVALTSYYGKNFVYRGRRKAYDFGEWLRAKVMLKCLDNADKEVTHATPTSAFDPTFHAPKAFTEMALGFRSLTAKGYTFLFDHTELRQNDLFEPYLKQKLWLIGTNGVKGDGIKHIVMDEFGSMDVVDKKGNRQTIGGFCEFLNIPVENAPVEYAEVSILGADIPIGLILAYYMGLNNLFKALGVTPVRVEAGKRLNMSTNQYAVQFLDETLLFDRNDKLASLIIAGFASYSKTCKKYSVYAFDKHAVYFNVFEANGLGNRYLREIDLIDKMFVDPITQDLLIQMEEPTNWQGLLLRSCELLLNDQHKNPQDMSEQRLRGYERVAGAIYTELIKSIRAHQGMTGKATKKLEMNPYAVWKRVFEDSAKEQIVEINPIQELRHVESVTFSGEGGRSKETMNQESREFTENDMGVISENTSDSSDVGINTYTSAAPNISTMTGLTKRLELAKDGVSTLISSSALLSPGADGDDPKRINFIGIQKGHLMACDGYHAPLLGTGYESVIGHRNTGMFCMTAKQAGSIIDKTDSLLSVLYADKSIDKIELGRVYGKAAGMTLPHDIVTTLDKGSKFKEGDALAFHSGFFEEDWLNPGQVVFKGHTLARTVLWEADTTFEDGSVISSRLAEKIMTKTTEVKNIIVNFDDDVSQLVEPGAYLEYDTVLCYIQDKVSAEAGVFDEKTLATLKMIDTQTPKANTKATVDKIEFYYHGMKEDLSKSLLKLANACDKAYAEKAKGLGKNVYTGQVDGSLRINGDPMAVNTACIRIYMTKRVEAGIGDKGVFCNQLKSVYSDVAEEDYLSQDGQVIDAHYGGRSVMARIVKSAVLMGTANSVLLALGKKATDIYFGE